MKLNRRNHFPAQTATAIAASCDRLPWGGLLALAMAAFICIFTETIPAGLLPQLSEGLGISEALAGQLVTSYALGSLMAAIPVTAATRGWPRRRLLLVTMTGFLAFNSVTAMSSDFALTLVARFFAGVSGGVLWGMAAGYARRMVPDALKGRALAVAMVGSPLAMALGVPAGTFLGGLAGWRAVFGIMSLMTVLLIVWIVRKMPEYPGQQAAGRTSLRTIFMMKGVRPVLAVVLLWVLAHNILYTYIAPYLARAGLAGRVDLTLLIFGLASIVGIWIVGMWIDRMQHKMVLVSLAGFALASLLLGVAAGQPALIYLAVALWGLTFGGAGTLLQTAMAETAGEHADVGQSMLVTAWNLAIGGGGFIGAVMLETMDAGSLPWALLLLTLLALLAAWRINVRRFTSRKRGEGPTLLPESE